VAPGELVRHQADLPSLRAETTVLTDLIEYVQGSLAEQADPEKAEGMQAYMKTDMPFYGVQKPERTRILRHIVKECAPQTHGDYFDAVTSLWELPHREEKYLAQGVATAFGRFIVPDSMPLYLRFIEEGAWWDFVDETATHMIRELILDFPAETWPIVEGWNEDENMWLRRTSIICQIGAKERTDVDRLFRFCRARMHEKEFFIRKAIGWALREYARIDAGAVATFASENREQLSGLSFREATKHIGHLVRQ
jgi:3-methyladenine DNA glycosylase AlkD